MRPWSLTRAVDIGVIFDAAGPDGDAALSNSGAEDAGAVEDMAMVDVAVDAQPPLVDAAPADAAPVNDAQVLPTCPEQPCELGRVCIDGQCLVPEPGMSVTRRMPRWWCLHPRYLSAGELFGSTTESG